jgi:hypothetical protein
MHALRCQQLPRKPGEALPSVLVCQVLQSRLLVPLAAGALEVGFGCGLCRPSVTCTVAFCKRALFVHRSWQTPGSPDFPASPRSRRSLLYKIHRGRLFRPVLLRCPTTVFCLIPSCLTRACVPKFCCDGLVCFANFLTASILPFGTQLSGPVLTQTVELSSAIYYMQAFPAAGGVNLRLNSGPGQPY